MITRSLEQLLLPGPLIGGTIVLCVVFVLIWLVSTVGEAALIRAVADFQDGQPRTVGQALSAGVALLGRFIALDTIIFFPLFLILLIQLLVLGGGLIAAILLLTQPGSRPDDLVPVGLIVALIVLPLGVISLPVTILSFIFRLFAFRSAALDNLPAKASMRRAWGVMQARLGEIVIVGLLLYALSYAVGMVTSLVTVPIVFSGLLFFAIPSANGQLPSAGNIDAYLWTLTLASLIGLVPGLLYYVFSSAVWTLAYREWRS
jgi:hypothetical protein